MLHRSRPPFLAALLLPLLLAPLARAQSGERKVGLDQVPAPVKSAIQRVVGQGTLVDIGEFDAQGTKTWEIEMVVAGKEYDVRFAADGTVLGRSFEGEKAAPAPAGAAATARDGFQADFDLAGRTFATVGRNRYFILEPGYQLVLEGPDGEHRVRLVITVLDETRTIGGVETRVVEERESADGELVEVSRNFVACCTRSHSIFYFGEEVDLYEGGEVVGHEGAWRHGQDGARAGILVPGEPLPGARYHQEVAPGVAMDRACVLDLDGTLETPAGTFTGCLRCAEDTPLEEGHEVKTHAPGIGLVQDEQLLLVRHGFVR